MKKLIVLFMVLAIAGIIYAAATETHSSKSISGQSSQVSKVVVAADCDPCCDNFTETLDEIYGYVERVAVDITGDDVALAIYIKDEYGIALFSKTDVNAVAGDFTYAISASDTGSTEFMGVPVAGTCSVQVADANTAGATEVTALNIAVYYRQSQ